MEYHEKEIEVARRHAVCVHETAELASIQYEQDRLYRREDLYQVLDAKRIASAQIIAELFLKAARQRDSKHLRALVDALFEAWEYRRIQRQLRARLGAARLGINGTDFFQRQQRMTELVGFLAMEILAVAFILAIRKGGDDAGGSTATYLISMVPELRPPCCQGEPNFPQLWESKIPHPDSSLSLFRPDEASLEFFL
jgi:hypothetical protein